MNLLDFILKKEKEMEEKNGLVGQDNSTICDNGGIVDIDELAKKVSVHAYFGMDSVSGDLVSFFNAANAKAAVRSFCNGLDPLPLSIVKDLVLVDAETREIVFEGKDYVEQWTSNQNYRLEGMIKQFKGALHA